MANPGLKGGIGLLAALLLGACGQGKDNAAPAAGAPAAGAPAAGAPAAGAPAAGAPAAGAPAAGVPAAGAPAAGGTVSAAADPGACAKYKEAICKEAGEQSEACGAFTSATQIMAPSACAAGLADMAGTVAKLGELKGKCTELAEKLCNDLGKDTQTCAMVKEKTPSFPPDRCATMMTEYPKVLAELQQMEKANQPLAPEVLTKLTAPGAPSFGPADAQVTIVEFSDFECPYCSIAAKTAKQIKEKYGSSSVRFVFRHYPLPFHQNAKPAAQASMAAMNQGKFWEFHDLMFENQKALTATDLEGYAQKLGLDMDRYKADMADATIGARIDADMKLGEEAGVNGTPTLFIGGSRVQNPGDFEGISAMIDKELAAR
ncbi:MAG: hypothetical protein AMXMBFR64_30570 [Myxococcales bacterium]